MSHSACRRRGRLSLIFRLKLRPCPGGKNPHRGLNTSLFITKEKLAEFYRDLLDVLKSVVSLFAGAHLNDVFDVIDEYLAVADVAGVKHLLCGLNNRSHGYF